ncbi:MAG: phytanoyl-CoA dioxygenase family protein [Pseudomonadota bacterium]
MLGQTLSNARMANGNVQPVDRQSQFRTHGTIDIRGALSPETLNLAESIWQHLIDHPGPRAATLSPDTLQRVSGLDEARQSSPTGLFYQDIMNRSADTALTDLIEQRDIRAIVQSIFAGDEHPSVPVDTRFAGAQVFLKEPRAARTGWHQDISDTQLSGMNLLVLWMSFDPVPEDYGLEVVRGSHVGPIYSSMYGEFRAQSRPDIDGAPPGTWDIARYASTPGDVILFHYGCLHGGAGTADFSRRSMALRFEGPGTRVRGVAGSA